MFSVATARLTPDLVEKYDSERLAAKFILVEQECHVKFNKERSTFSVTGEWSAIRNAHTFLKQLVAEDLADLSNNCGKSNSSKSEKTKKVPEKEIFYKTAGNPKRGRHAIKSEYKSVPEPGIFVQYQNKAYDRPEDLDIDIVLDNFEKANIVKKVNKEDLKKVLKKNKEQMGRPLGNGVPKGAIVSKKSVSDISDQSQPQTNQVPDLSVTNLTICNARSNDCQTIGTTVYATSSSMFDPVIASVTSFRPHQDDVSLLPGKASALPESVEKHVAELLDSGSPNRCFLNQEYSNTCAESTLDNPLTELLGESESMAQQQYVSKNLNEIETLNVNNSPSVTSLCSEEVSFGPSGDGTVSNLTSSPVTPLTAFSQSNILPPTSMAGNFNSQTTIAASVQSNFSNVTVDMDETNRLQTTKQCQVELLHLDNGTCSKADEQHSGTTSNCSETGEHHPENVTKALEITADHVSSREISMDKTWTKPDNRKEIKHSLDMDTNQSKDDPVQASGTSGNADSSEHTAENIITSIKQDINGRRQPNLGRGRMKVESKPAKEKVRKSGQKSSKPKTTGKKVTTKEKSVSVETSNTNDETIKKPKTRVGRLVKHKKAPPEKKKVTSLGTAHMDPEGQTVFKCTECDYEGYRKKRLTEHMGRVHGLLTDNCRGTLEKIDFKCDLCNKTFVFGKDLNRHKKIVHHNEAYVCEICNKVYKSSYVFKKHQTTHQEGYVQPMFKCQLCEREFTTKFSLSSHIKSSHLAMKKTYSCPLCGKTFSQIRSYRQHANVHAGIRPYQCEICSKSFTYDKSLKEHRYMHDTVRRFSCTVCGKDFRQKTCLLIHMKVHSDKKDHICGYCGRGFTQKQSLVRHERIHTGDRPYQCSICSKSFNDYAVIRKHLMMTHKKDKDMWKDCVIQEVRAMAEHYISGGPGYKPRESSDEIRRKNQATVIPTTIPGRGPTIIATLIPTDEHQQQSTLSSGGKADIKTDQVKDLYEKAAIVHSESQNKPISNLPVSSLYHTAVEINPPNLTGSSDVNLPITSSVDVHTDASTVSMTLPTSIALNNPGLEGYLVPSSDGVTSQALNYQHLTDESLANSFLKSQANSNTNIDQSQYSTIGVTMDTLDTIRSIGEGQQQQLYSVTPGVPTTPVSSESVQSFSSSLNSPWNIPTYSDAFYNNGIFSQYQQGSPNQQEF